MSEESTAVVRQGFEADGRGVLQIKTLADAIEQAKLLANTDFVPTIYQGKPGNVLAAIQMGAEVGLPPMQALQNIAVINGRPCVWGDAALSLVRSHPDFDGIEETHGNGAATCKVYRVERSRLTGKPRRVEVARSFSIDDAKRAGLLNKKGPWQEYPARMLQMRARGFAIRDAFPDALRGIATREEAMDVRRIELDDDQPVTTATELPAAALPPARSGPGRVRAMLNEQPAPPPSPVSEMAAHMISAANNCQVADDLNAIAHEFDEARADMEVGQAEMVARALDRAQARLEAEGDAG